MIKYIGSKRLLVPVILRAIRSLDDVKTVLDLFSGTSRVGHALKKAGYRVFANDHNAYAAVLARCYVQADAEDVLEEASRLIKELNRLPGKPGYFTETFCTKSRFFQPQNGERIDAIREEIAKKCLEPELESVLLTSLVEAADRVDSTVGVQMAYLKRWAPRSYQPLELRVPEVLPRAAAGKGWAFQLDALDAAQSLEGDVAYVDPPYNQHSYLNNYHIWETLVLWDKPSVYGRACKRTDCRTRHSPFNRRKTFANALRAVLAEAKVRYLVVSFSSDGFLSRGQLETILGELGKFLRIEMDYKRYVGAKIGIYNPQGVKVGKVGRLYNKEYVYVLAKDGAEPPSLDCLALAQGTRLL